MKILKTKSHSENGLRLGFWRRNWKKTWFRILTILIGLALIGVISWLLTGYSLAKRIFTVNFSGGSQLLKLLTHSTDPLKGQSDGRVNVLLLGYGGTGHDGPYLTDTIQLVSIDTKNNKVAMISLPRDLYVETKNPYYAGKINALYTLGKPVDPKSKYDSAALVEDEVSTITGLPIHYYASLDFDGFKKAIDQVDGIDLTVDRTFTDYEYPADKGDGFLPPQTFKSGPQHMDGARALIYTRSRHSAGGEGSDFARSLRQQKVLAAFKTKLTSSGMLDNPARVLSLIDVLSSSLRTDMQPTEIKALATLLKGVDTSNVISKTLDNSPEGLLADFNNSDEIYYLKPRAGVNNWSQIQNLAKNIFNSQNTINYAAKIEILNGSQISGQASSLAAALKNYGFTNVSVDKSTVVSQTVIYDYTDGAQKSTLDFLADKLDCSVIKKSKTDSINYDISIVLGNNYKDISGALKESSLKQSGT